nr:substrate-binding domain-containing protein [Candidatus Sigynarchaeota archaeon]
MQRKLLGVIIIGIVAAGIGVTITAAILLSPVPKLRLSTTTSVNDSHLMDVLIPDFEQRFGVDVLLSPKGSGAAIADGSNGDADLLLVHSRASELAFVADGNGSRRACFMFNDFILVGPTADPAGILSGAPNNITKAFWYCHDNLTDKEVNPFVSRNDSSGTHTKEKDIWKLAPPHKSYTAITTGHPWYLCANTGMGATLTMTNEKNGYTLTDRATWWSMITSLTNLKSVCENDSSGIMINPYSLILVNSTRHPNVNQPLAEKFVAFCLSDYGLAKVANYTAYGHSLFTVCWNNTSSYSVTQSLTEDIDWWNNKVIELGMNTLV